MENVKKKMTSISVYFSTNNDLFKKSRLSTKFSLAISQFHILTDFRSDVFRKMQIITLKQIYVHSCFFSEGRKIIFNTYSFRLALPSV